MSDEVCECGRKRPCARPDELCKFPPQLSWKQRAEAAESDNARLKAALRKLAVTTQRISRTETGLIHTYHCSICASLWLESDEKHEPDCALSPSVEKL